MTRRHNRDLQSAEEMVPWLLHRHNGLYLTMPMMRHFLQYPHCDPQEDYSHRSKSYVQYPMIILYNSPLQITHHPPFRTIRKQDLQIMRWVTEATRHCRPTRLEILAHSQPPPAYQKDLRSDQFRTSLCLNHQWPSFSRLDERQVLDRRPLPGEDLHPTTLKCRMYHQSLKSRRHGQIQFRHDMALSRPVTSSL